MYIFLQQYWWLVVSLLGAILVFLLFVQGGNSLLFCLGKTEEHRKIMVNSTGRKWDVYYVGDVWRSFLCFFPVVLQYQFRWCLLALDDYTFQFCIAGCQL